MMNLKHLFSIFCFVFGFFMTSNAQMACDYNGVKLGSGIYNLIQQKDRPADKMTVILTFHGKEIAQQARKELKAAGYNFVGPDFTLLPWQGIYATIDEVDKMIETIPGIAGIWENQPVNTELHQAVIVSSVKDVWDDSEFATLNDGLTVEGNGIGVLVNDSGFDGDNTDLQATDEGNLNARIVQNVRGNGTETGGEFEPGWIESTEADTDQGGGHGSHVMGIVGGDGRKSNGKYKGVAPGAYLIGYGSGAALFILDTGGGFEYVLRHGRDYNIRVMSNSFGTTSDTMFMEFNETAPLNIATKALVEEGVVVVFSAGNSGPTDGKITGNYKTAPWVVTVGNGTKGGALAGSSSRGRKDSDSNSTSEPTDDGIVHPSQREPINVDGTDYLWENRPTVTAPGTDIVSVRASGSAIAPLAALDDVNLEQDELQYYTILSGTSMACPHVAGIVALMMEANPNLEFRAVKATLQRTAIDAMSEAFYQRGAGYVNAHAAVAAAFHGLCDVPEDATYEEKYGLAANGAFGFDDDPWKACPLHPEVLERIKMEIPSAEGVEAACGDEEPPVTDDTGLNETEPASSTAHFDIKEVRFHDETATHFNITMEVEGNLAASPVGETGVSQHFYDVHFKLTKPVGDNPFEEPTPDIIYIASSFNDATDGHSFRLTVRSADGTTRPVTNGDHYDEITGNWNTTDNTITWDIPKNLLNVSSTPGGTSEMGERNSRSATAGDVLGKWGAYVYERVGTITPDGPGAYTDSAEGSCFKTLQIEDEE